MVSAVTQTGAGNPSLLPLFMSTSMKFGVRKAKQLKMLTIGLELQSNIKTSQNCLCHTYWAQSCFFFSKYFSGFYHFS